MISEAAFQQAVIDLARWTGWRIFHPRTVHTAQGTHLTAFYGDAGFPDLVLVHRNRGVIFAELKSERGRLTNDQTLWGEYLKAAGVEYHVWRPDDMETVKDILRKLND